MSPAIDAVLRFIAEDIVIQSRADLGTELTNPAGRKLRLTEETQDHMRDVASELWTKLGVQHCVTCACTEWLACEGGCSWAAPNRCSSCVERSINRLRAATATKGSMLVAEHTYGGYRGGPKAFAVQRNGRPWAYSTDDAVRGYAWGSVDAGARRLAFALLADATGDRKYAKEHAELFVKRCLTALPQRWNLTAAEIVQLVSGMYAVQTSAVNPKST